jgi:AraC-like DNA-binding protein
MNAEFTAPWCIWSSFGHSNVRVRMAKPQDVLFFHFITEGTCKLKVQGQPDTLELAEGDMILFPSDDRHVIGSDLRLAPVETAHVVLDGRHQEPDFVQLRHGGGGATTRFVCGYIACDPIVCGPLLDPLPPMIHLRMGNCRASALIRELLQVAVRESLALRPGAEATVAKLSELMFVEALRQYVNLLPPLSKGWLAGVRDPRVGRALSLLHAEPSRDWTVDHLAARVALSRSTLSKRFTNFVGEPPMQYLMKWRLSIAANALRRSNEVIARIAARNGYESEESFSRAFKREYGVSPAQWRRALAN